MSEAETAQDPSRDCASFAAAPPRIASFTNSIAYIALRSIDASSELRGKHTPAVPLLFSLNSPLQVQKDNFWSRFRPQRNIQSYSYSTEGMERTLETVGVECNTHASSQAVSNGFTSDLYVQEDGRPVSTGRWILLRNGFFLLRAAHTIQWIENPSLTNSPGDAKNVDMPPVVWDWKSSAERWRWSIYGVAEVGTPMMVEVVDNGSFDEVSDLL